MNACRHSRKTGPCSQCLIETLPREPAPFVETPITLTSPRRVKRVVRALDFWARAHTIAASLARGRTIAASLARGSRA